MAANGGLLKSETIVRSFASIEFMRRIGEEIESE